MKAFDANTDIIQLTTNNGIQIILGFPRRIKYDYKISGGICYISNGEKNIKKTVYMSFCLWSTPCSLQDGFFFSNLVEDGKIAPKK